MQATALLDNIQLFDFRIISGALDILLESEFSQQEVRDELITLAMGVRKINIIKTS